MIKKTTSYVNKLKNSFVKNKRVIYLVFFGLVIAAVFYGIGLSVGDGQIQFGNGQFITFNTSNAQGLPSTLNYQALQQEYNILKENFDGKLSAQQLQDGIQTGLVNATGDPYTEYFNASAANAFNNQLNNTFSGIGAELGQNAKGQLIIIAPLSGYPADKAGIKAQDIILTINGVSTSGENIDNAINAIRGPNGTTVTLVVQRNNQQITYKIVRQQITAPSVQYSIINGDIGYLQIIDFSNDTASLAQTAANNFKAKGVKYVILDLRDNPGGLVTAAVSVSSLWLPQGQTIMTEKHNNQVVQIYQSTGNDILQGLPTVVLINGGSASASEITASALHDNKAATLIGVKSFGKGSVQEVDPLFGGAEIKVTIAHWFTPDNKSINKIGIQPDIVVNENNSNQSSAVDLQKNAAIQYLQSH